MNNELQDIRERIGVKANQLVKNFCMEMNETYQQIVGLIRQQSVSKSTLRQLAEYKGAVEAFIRIFSVLNVSDRFTPIPVLPTDHRGQDVNDQDIVRDAVDELDLYQQRCISKLEDNDKLKASLDHSHDIQKILKNLAHEMQNQITDFIDSENIHQFPELLQTFLCLGLQKNLMQTKIDQYDADNIDITEYKIQKLEKQTTLLNEVLSLLLEEPLDENNFLKCMYAKLEKKCRYFTNKLLELTTTETMKLNALLPLHLQIQVSNSGQMDTQLYNQIINQVDNFLTFNKEGFLEDDLEHHGVNDKNTQNSRPKNQIETIQLKINQLRLNRLISKRDRMHNFEELFEVIEKYLVQSGDYNDLVSKLAFDDDVSGTGFQLEQLQRPGLVHLIDNLILQTERYKQHLYALTAWKQFIQVNGIQNISNDTRDECISQLERRIEDFSKQQLEMLQSENLTVSLLNNQSMFNSFMNGITVGVDSTGAGHSCSMKHINRVIDQYVALDIQKSRFRQAVDKLNTVSDYTELQNYCDQQNTILKQNQQVITEYIKTVSYQVLQNEQLDYFIKYVKNPEQLIISRTSQRQTGAEIELVQADIEVLLAHLEQSSSIVQKVHYYYTKFIQERDFLSQKIIQNMKEMSVIQHLLSQPIQSDGIEQYYKIDSSYDHLSDRISQFELNDMVIQENILKRLQNRLLDVLHNNLTIFRRQLSNYMQETDISSNLIIDSVKNIIQYYKNLTSEPEVVQIHSQFNQNIQLYAEQYFKNKMYAIFNQFNEISEGEVSMYKEDLFSQKYRLQHLVQLVTEQTHQQFQQSSERVAAQLPQSYFISTQLQAQTVTPSDQFVNSYYRNMNDLFQQNQVQEMCGRSQFAGYYQQIMQFRVNIQKNYDFTELLQQVTSKINALELMTNKFVRTVKQDMDMYFQLFSNEKLIQLHDCYTRLFRAKVGHKMCLWSGSGDGEGIQDYETSIAQARKQIQRIEETILQEVQFTLNENIDQLLDDQIQLNRILKTKYEDTREEISEGEEQLASVPQRRDPLEASQLLSLQQRLDEASSDKSAHETLPLQEQRPPAQDAAPRKAQHIAPAQRPQLDGAQLSQMRQLLSQLQEKEVSVNRVVNTGMQPFKLQLVGFDTIKLVNCQDNKAMQIKTANIRTVRLKKKSLNGAELSCVEIYLWSAKSVVFAFYSDEECRRYIRALHFCVKMAGNTQELQRLLA